MPEFDPAQIIDLAIVYGIKIALALAIYIVGKWIVASASAILMDCRSDFYCHAKGNGCARC